MTILLLIARHLGVTGIVAIGIVLFYEGLPLGPIRYIPFVGPALEQFVDGRVDRERRAALEGYVKQVELDAARAKNAELQRQLAAGRKAADGFAELLREAQERMAADAAADQQKEAEYEAQLAAAGRSCLLDRSDLDWLRQ